MIQIYKKNQIETFLKKFESRREQISQEVRVTVQEILNKVHREGDKSLFDYTLQYDGVDTTQLDLKVSKEEIKESVQSTPENFLNILRGSAENVRRYHEKGKRTSWLSWEKNGVVLGQQVIPLQRVGIYVPGGRAVYPSSLIMAAVPAQVAEVEEIVVVSPPTRSGKVHPSILSAAYILGIEEIYRIGGAQAVAALAFGTQSIRPVHKIVGPGNLYVAEAKRQVFGICDIDMIAGPSEVIILADNNANPDFVAADLLAQAEHDPSASSVLVTPSSELARKAQQSLQKQGETLSRKEIFETSLKKYGGILLVENLTHGIGLVNTLAPEHLGLHVKNPWEILGEIRNAGAIFLGSFSPETVGDYWAGPNHILPTNRTARFASPLGTEDFMKRSSLILYTKTVLEKEAGSIITFAKMEGLDAHANAVQQRIS